MAEKFNREYFCQVLNHLKQVNSGQIQSTQHKIYSDFSSLSQVYRYTPPENWPALSDLETAYAAEFKKYEQNRPNYATYAKSEIDQINLAKSQKAVGRGLFS